MLRMQGGDDVRRIAAFHHVAAGAAVLDYEADLLDPATGLVAERYRSRDPLNHHLDAQAFCELVTDRLRGLGFS